MNTNLIQIELIRISMSDPDFKYDLCELVYPYQINSGQSEPQHVKTCLQGLQPGPTQTSLYSLRRKLKV